MSCRLTPRALVSVFRRYQPSRSQLAAVTAGGASNPLLAQFVDQYSSGATFYDWGDDPAFFAATVLNGRPEYATWGVCRPNVRSWLAPDDMVAFFCAKQVLGASQHWQYHYIGVGAVADCLSRPTIWSTRANARYRDYFNLLVRPLDGALVHHEVFSPKHSDWQHRSAQSYVTFDPSRSKFNLSEPLLVADFTGSLPELWRSAVDPQVKALEELIFPPTTTRRLRTSIKQYAHVPFTMLPRGTPARRVAALAAQLKALV